MLMVVPAHRKLTQELAERLRVTFAKFAPLEPGNQRLDFSRVSRIGIWVFLHRRWRRFYAGRRSEARAIGAFLSLSRYFAAGDELPVQEAALKMAGSGQTAARL